MSKQTKEVTQLADMGSLELTEEVIRQRAYELFEQHGCEPGMTSMTGFRQRRRSWDRNRAPSQIKAQPYTK